MILPLPKLWSHSVLFCQKSIKGQKIVNNHISQGNERSQVPLRLQIGTNPLHHFTYLLMVLVFFFFFFLIQPILYWGSCCSRREWEQTGVSLWCVFFGIGISDLPLAHRYIIVLLQPVGFLEIKSLSGQMYPTAYPLEFDSSGGVVKITLCISFHFDDSWSLDNPFSRF